jgi:hypothetical protein
VSEANDFLILNGAIVTLLLIYFFVFRAKNTPSPLNFKKSSPPLSEISFPEEGERGEALNVIFNYNGHSFDAYEVLGVPAGSTLEEIQAIYQKNKQLVDPASREFFRVAMETITQHLQKRRP